MLDAGSMCLSKVTEPGSSTLKTIKIGTRFMTTINFDITGPMNPENIGLAASNRSRTRRSFAKGP